MACFSATGAIIPPEFMHKRKRMRPLWVYNLPDGTACQITPVFVYFFVYDTYLQAWINIGIKHILCAMCLHMYYVVCMYLYM